MPCFHQSLSLSLSHMTSSLYFSTMQFKFQDIGVCDCESVIIVGAFLAVLTNLLAKIAKKKKKSYFNYAFFQITYIMLIILAINFYYSI
jgi:hypothetical protein